MSQSDEATVVVVAETDKSANNKEIPKSGVKTGVRLEIIQQHFCFTPDDLGAPDAVNPSNLFDWQGQSDLKQILEKFGGIKNIADSLGTDLVKVRYFIHSIRV